MIDSKRFELSLNFSTKTAISKSNWTKAVPYATKSITTNLIQFSNGVLIEMRSTANNCRSQSKRIEYLIQNELKTNEKQREKNETRTETVLLSVCGTVLWFVAGIVYRCRLHLVCATVVESDLQTIVRQTHVPRESCGTCFDHTMRCTFASSQCWTVFRDSKTCRCCCSRSLALVPCELVIVGVRVH